MRQFEKPLLKYETLAKIRQGKTLIFPGTNESPSYFKGYDVCSVR